MGIYSEALSVVVMGKSPKGLVSFSQGEVYIIECRIREDLAVCCDVSVM